MKASILLLFLLAVFSIHSQDLSFYNKRFQLTLGAGGNFNLVSYLSDGNERSFRSYHRGTEFYKKSSKGLFNYSFHATVGYSLTKKLGLSIDFNYLHGSALSLRAYNVKYTQSYDVRFEYRSYRIMPRVEFSAKNNSNAPVGLTYIVGLGIEFTVGISKNYPSNYYTYNTYEKVFKYQKISFSRSPKLAMTSLLGAEYRIPITRWMAINLGGYFHLNLNPSLIIFNSEYSSPDDRNERKILQSRLSNLFSCRAGVMFMI
ncbi:hypothetical protein [Fluviicola taffensis]|uniref:Outer membrane protein beta-barrel domain-containing protein n=1 Tax=Fluviicola taffensis (strain DSM 16823 / NCIMB 13979 / RW262) TaxID=755732 RepID=F2IIE0_FLUTR|nr:hypothetical protein [Fluviicola taffensis]AEA44866.1 hypothetical protein Fluta_2887 [Fluviicola taffensis DSM 16823]